MGECPGLNALFFRRADTLLPGFMLAELRGGSALEPWDHARTKRIKVRRTDATAFMTSQQQDVFAVRMRKCLLHRHGKGVQPSDQLWSK